MLELMLKIKCVHYFLLSEMAVSAQRMSSGLCEVVQVTAFGSFTIVDPEATFLCFASRCGSKGNTCCFNPLMA